MQMSYISCLLLFLVASHRSLADEESSTDTNEIIQRETIEKLDYSVRLALLRAIDKLEKEASGDDGYEDKAKIDKKKTEPIVIIPSSITIQSTTAVPLSTQSKDELLEESTSSSDIFPSVQFFAATYDESNAEKEQPLVVYIDKSKNKIDTNLDSPMQVIIHGKNYSKSSIQTVRSISNTNVQNNEIPLNSLDEVKFEISNTKTNQQISPTAEGFISNTTITTPAQRRTIKKRTTTTTTTTSTTTTSRPTHNEDGEYIENGTHVQAAPLDSTFTADLDELGTVKEVIPIINSASSASATMASSTQRIEESSLFQPPLYDPTINELNVLSANAQQAATLNLTDNLLPAPKSTQSTFASSTVSNIFSNVVPTSRHFITKQPSATNLNQQHEGGSVNNYLFEKQRELEQQIYQLKLQVQEQQELLISQLKQLEEQAK